jgi:hypothetical protein
VITIDNSDIVTWDERSASPTHNITSNEEIATQSTPDPESKWGKCIDALIDVWKRAAPDEPELDEETPNRAVVEAALHLLCRLRKLLPSNPPTLVAQEPGGGLIIELQFNTEHERVIEFTLYNNGTAEVTDYHAGRVTYMKEIPFPLR